MNRNIDNRTLTLPPLLDEFRTALQDEIEAAKRNASNSAIPLSNGHKVASQGSAHQYSFLIDSVLNTPDGTPGDLIVSGKAPLVATIVSAEGLRIVISVETDLGKFIPTARLQTNLSILMRKLIERIEKNSNKGNPAAKRMLGKDTVSGTPVSLNDKPKLNDSQLRALQSALGRNLTVIWGPPGTGKTHTIGTITEYLHARSRTVLLVSHTNTAVDQAICHVASSMKEQIKEGVVVRVGEVRDEVLRTDYPDVLIKTQIERQSRDLVEDRDKLTNTRQELANEISAVQKSIDIIEWLGTVNQEIETIQKIIIAHDELKEQEQQAKKEFAEIREQHSYLLGIHEQSTKVLRLRKLLLTKQEEQSNLQAEISSTLEKQDELNKKLSKQVKRIEIALRIAPIRKELITYPSQTEQKVIVLQLTERIAETKQGLIAIQVEFTKAKDLLDETISAGTISRIFKRLPKPNDQQTIVNNLSKQVTTHDTEIVATQQAHNVAIAKLARIIEMDGQLNQHKDIDSYNQELKLKMQVERKLEQIATKNNEQDLRLFDLQTQISGIQREDAGLSGEIDGDVKEIYNEACSKLQKYKELQEIVKLSGKHASEMQNKAERLLSHLVSSIQQWTKFEDNESSVKECLSAVLIAHSTLYAKYGSVNLETLTKRVDLLKAKIQKLSNQIAEIELKLAEVEREVINNATVVGATLTKTYLSDIIQGRKFDTVILDEASMAPIPALWAAALLAENNLIIVGDFKQLPPIVLSSKKLTKKWLGRDIFEVSGIREMWDMNDPPLHFIPLDEQRRMLPEIAEVANLFYDGLLKNTFTSPEQYKDFRSFTEWYSKDWSHDNPVLLVDTEPLHAWVTSVVKSGNSSRLNFLSATVAVDISEQLLSPDRATRSEGAAKRILIVSPYRAHAKLVSVLLKDLTNLQDEVVAGTAHSFQGSEADVVIFDLVADEPHWKVNLFIPNQDEQLKCLLNVALTRAKFRLVIIGDFAYCRKHGKNAFLGKTLIPFLLGRFPCIDARKIVPDGLAARAAKAQMSTLGGNIDPNTDRIVVTQVDFYGLLSNDLGHAVQRVIIYSPFVTLDRLAFLLPQLQAAIERDVRFYVITKSLSERPPKELSTIRKIEKQLSELGVVVIHKLHMHEKLVFIDDDITWSGSLNPLSFSNTQEIMERRKSRVVLKDYFQILRLQELIAVQETPKSKCPICGNEMIVAEGADQPYYWRCTNDKCYTRSIDQPYPFNGILTCGNCDSAVEYGYWGDYPHWRCTANNRHRQKIFKSHLRLPKMAALVPRNEQRKLCRLLNIDDFDEYTLNLEPDRNRNTGQMNLFD